MSGKDTISRSATNELLTISYPRDPTRLRWRRPLTPVSVYRLPTDRWFREAEMAIDSRLLKPLASKVCFLLPRCTKKTRNRHVGNCGGSKAFPWKHSEWPAARVQAASRWIAHAHWLLRPASRPIVDDRLHSGDKTLVRVLLRILFLGLCSSSRHAWKTQPLFNNASGFGDARGAFRASFVHRL